MTRTQFSVPIQILETTAQAAAIKTAAAQSGQSVSNYIRQAIREKMARESRSIEVPA